MEEEYELTINLMKELERHLPKEYPNLNYPQELREKIFGRAALFSKEVLKERDSFNPIKHT